MKRQYVTAIIAMILLPISGVFIYKSFIVDSPNRHSTRPEEVAALQHAYLYGDSSPAPDRSASKWFLARSDINTRLLETQNYDVLVVPFQAQARSVDAIGRSIITRRLINKLAAASGLRIPDPTLVESALIENSRTFSEERIAILANKLGVSKVIQEFVGRPRKSDGNITIRITTREKNTEQSHHRAKFLKYQSNTWEGIAFDHVALPSEAAKKHIDEIVEWLGFSPTAGVRAPAPRGELNSLTPIPESLTDLSTKRNGNSIQAIEHLQLLGLFYPEHTPRDRERIFDRSLVALDHVDKTAAKYKLLKARALFYLHRRPAAVAEIRNPESPEERAFLSLLNGDPDEMRKSQSAIGSKLQLLVSQIEHYKYVESSSGGEILNPKDYVTMTEIEETTFKYFVNRTLREAEIWFRPSSYELKQSLDQHFPLSGFSADALLQGAAVLRDRNDLDFATKSIQHIRKLLENDPKIWCCELPFSRINPIDVLQLFASHAEANVVSRAHFHVNPRGSPAAALETINALSAAFDDHPGVAAVRSLAHFDIAKNAIGLAQTNALANTIEEGLDALAWYGGQNNLIHKVKVAIEEIAISPAMMSKLPADILQARKTYFNDDFPRIANWDNYDYPNPKTRYEPWNYAHDDPFIIYAVARQRFRANGIEAANEFLAKHAHRYQSDPYLPRVKIRYLKEIGFPKDAEPVARAAIENGARVWSIYGDLGKSLAERGQYAEAFEIFMKYPPFLEEDGGNGVALYNYSNTAGSYLFWRGSCEYA